MRCKKHAEDDSSLAGVCAYCLRQRLVSLIAAQAQATEGSHFKEYESESNYQALIHPRSVSPYISRRKLNNDQKFFSTPQIGPVRKVIVEDNCLPKKKGSRKFWFSNWFRSKSAITITDFDSKSWFSSILSRRKKLPTCSIDESASRSHRRSHRNRGQGMSPAKLSDDEEVTETSGCTTEELKQTPRRTPGRNGGGRRRQLSRNVSDIVFCLSPLVRPSPNRIWNQKGGLPPENGISGESRVPVKACNNITASFCKNRSRKLAEFGRGNRNH